MFRKVNIGAIENVKKFVQSCCKAPFEVEVISDRYTVDGKSIMGVFSLNLSEPVTIHFECDDDRTVDTFLMTVKEFLVD